MFSGVYWNQPVCVSVHESICVQNATFYQSTGGGIKSHSMTALVKSNGPISTKLHGNFYY